VKSYGDEHSIDLNKKKNPIRIKNTYNNDALIRQFRKNQKEKERALRFQNSKINVETEIENKIQYNYSFCHQNDKD